MILHVANKAPQCISIPTLSLFQTVRSCYSSPEAAASPFSFKWFTCGKSRPFCRKTPTSAKLNRNVNVRLRFDCVLTEIASPTLCFQARSPRIVCTDPCRCYRKFDRSEILSRRSYFLGNFIAKRYFFLGNIIAARKFDRSRCHEK